MLVLPQTIKTKWHSGNKQWYTEKGYIFTRIKDELEVNVLDLPLKSKVLIKVICDICGEPLSKSYADYSKSHSKNGDACKNCTVKKLSNNKRRTIKEVKNIFEENNCFLLTTKYMNSSQKLDYICECGNKSEITLPKFLAGQRCKKCGYEKMTGENNHKWNPNLTDMERENKRDFLEYKHWRLSVYERDDYICQYCGIRGKKLNAHHLDGYNWCKEKRTDIDNGVSLCDGCHNNFHNQYGFGGNTKEQFEEWVNK